MKVVPMMFNAEMVKALVDGNKVVTRRQINIPDGWDLKDNKLCRINSSHPKKGKWGAMIRRPFSDGKFEHDLVPAPCVSGDLIYVRETFCVGRIDETDAEHPLDRHLEVSQCAGDNDFLPRQWLESEGICTDEVYFKPSIHMPRKASRLTLKVKELRIERVQDITEPQAKAEGMPANALASFNALWDKMYGNWSKNPYVWVIEFEVIHANVDTVLARESAAA